MSKRIRDALQQQGAVAAKKPKRSTPAARLATAGEDEEYELSTCRLVPSAAPSGADAAAAACSTTAAADGLSAAMIAGAGSCSGTRLRRLLWLCGMGVEDLVLGWFPFSEEDFAGQASWVDDDDYDGHGVFDDIWQIKHIHEIPKPNATAAASST